MRGQTDDPRFATFGERVTYLARAASCARLTVELSNCDHGSANAINRIERSFDRLIDSDQIAMKIKAAILWERGQPLSVEDAELDPPGAGEVLVEIKAAGVCHSDLHPARDDWPTRTPLVLGHEGAGIVREVGAGVTACQARRSRRLVLGAGLRRLPLLRAGLAVLCDRLDKTTYRNRLPSGATPLHARGQDLGQFLSTACFAEYAVVAEEAAVVVDRDVPFDALATLGCAVVTGVGAVLTAARVPRGARVAVIGAGGVGLNVVQGAVIAGARADHRRRPPARAARACADVRRDRRHRRGRRRRPDGIAGEPIRELTTRPRRRLRLRYGRHAGNADRRARRGAQGRDGGAHRTVANRCRRRRLRCSRSSCRRSG